jgi:hypothetical protein
MKINPASAESIKVITAQKVKEQNQSKPAPAPNAVEVNLQQSSKLAELAMLNDINKS